MGDAEPHGPQNAYHILHPSISLLPVHHILMQFYAPIYNLETMTGRKHDSFEIGLISLMWLYFAIDRNRKETSRFIHSTDPFL